MSDSTDESAAVPWRSHTVQVVLVSTLLAFWATPRMAVGHLVFASGMTAYVLVGVTLEERDMIAAFGDRYRQYRMEVPIFVPWLGRTVTFPSDDVDGDPK
jgi:protein-S-isoprenylcysteine O-methyltransferase Ste14